MESQQRLNEMSSCLFRWRSKQETEKEYILSTFMHYSHLSDIKVEV
jgi:hypothetical protein